MPGANNDFHKDFIFDKEPDIINKIQKYKWKLIHISPFADDSNNEQILYLLRKLKEGRNAINPIIILDPGTFLCRLGLSKLAKAFLKLCNVIFLKEIEILKLGRENPLNGQELSLREAVENIFRVSHDDLIIYVEQIRNGGFTVFIKNNSEHYSLPGELLANKDIIDDTGIGDIFNAAVIYSMMIGKSFGEANVLKLIKLMTDIKLQSMGREGYAEFVEKRIEIDEQIRTEKIEIKDKRNKMVKENIKAGFDILKKSIEIIDRLKS